MCKIAKWSCAALSFVASCSSPAVAADTPAVEVRFCPASAVRTYPMESRRELRSLVLQNMAVINRGAAAFEVEAIDLELLQDGQVFESKRLDETAVRQAAERGAKLQASGVLQQVAFQFCGTDLIPPSVTLAGPTLSRNQALLVVQQVFAFDEEGDTVRARVHGEIGGKPVEVSGTLAISSDAARNDYVFPLRGTYFVGWGPSLHTGHRWLIPEEFALDIAKLGGNGLTHRGDGVRFEDYYAYGADVLAAADGVVVHATNDQPEDPHFLQRPGESQEAYSVRQQKNQAGLLAKSADAIAGNYVIIDHGKGQYALYAHLQPGSVRVHAGDRVKAGEVLGKLGSSGNSTEPHLHFQVCDQPDPLMCAGIPVDFGNVTILWADEPRPIQSGDIVTTR